jgi:hypothetical protein
MVQPPSTQSVAETRTPSGRSAGQAARNRLEHLQRKAHALLGAVAIAVGAPVAERREELVEQIAVADMQLGQLEAEPGSPLGCCHELRLDGGEAGRVQRLGHVPVGRIGQGGGSERGPGLLAWPERPAAILGRVGRALAAGMGELDAERGHPVAPAERQDAPEGLLIGVAV